MKKPASELAKELYQEKESAPQQANNSDAHSSLFVSILSYFQEKGKKIQQYSDRRFGKSFVTNCIFHQDNTPSFYVHEAGFYKCFGCGKKGSLYSLAIELGLEVLEKEVSLKSITKEGYEKAIEYISNRFKANKEETKNIMRLFNLHPGIYKKQNEKLLGIWIDLFNGSWTFRSIEGKAYRNKEGTGKLPGFANLLDIVETTTVIITEGVFDALTINYIIKAYEQTAQAKSPYVAICTQGDMFTPDKIFDFLKSKGISKVIFAFDNDEKGKKNEEDYIRTALEYGFLTELVIIPEQYKDVNEFYINDTELFTNAFSEENRLSVFEWYIQKNIDKLEKEESKIELVEKLKAFLKKSKDPEAKTKFEAVIRKYKLEQYASEIVKVTPSLNFINAYEILNKEYPPRDFVVEGLLPTGLVLFAGKPKLGKSWFAQYLSIHVATNTPLFGLFDIKKNGDVFYFALEDYEARLSSRERLLLEHISLDLADEDLLKRLHYFVPTLEQQFRLNEEGYLILESIAQKSSLIIIDTYVRAKEHKNYKSEYDYETQILSRLQRIALQHNTCILLIHHTKKSSSEDIFDNILGSTALMGVADVTIIFDRLRVQSKDQEKARMVKLHVTGRDVEEQSIALEFDIQNRIFFEFKGNAEEYELGELQEELLRLLTEPCTLKELSELTNRNKGNILKALRKLEEKGLITRFSKNKQSYFLKKSH